MMPLPYNGIQHSDQELTASFVTWSYHMMIQNDLATAVRLSSRHMCWAVASPLLTTCCIYLVNDVTASDCSRQAASMLLAATNQTEHHTQNHPELKNQPCVTQAGCKHRAAHLCGILPMQSATYPQQSSDRNGTDMQRLYLVVHMSHCDKGYSVAFAGAAAGVPLPKLNILHNQQGVPWHRTKTFQALHLAAALRALRPGSHSGTAKMHLSLLLC